MDRTPVPISKSVWQKQGKLQLEAESEDPLDEKLQDVIVVKESSVSKVQRRIKKETAQFEKESARAGLSGLTLEEKVLGVSFGSAFQAMPDPITEVRADIDTVDIS